MTERLYYTDSYARSFRAHVLRTEDSGRRVYLDRTAFYPASGGQPSDTGLLGGVAIVEVVDEASDIAHILAEPVVATEIEGLIDWPRRFDHMQQHTGQHLLSAAFIEVLQADTISFHMGAEVSTIELAIPKLEDGQMAEVEQRANELVAENRPVEILFEDAAEQAALRKQSARSGTLRIVQIPDLDRSACGGTHVRSTGEIGSVLLRGTERIRGNIRVEFVCGLRAARRARNDYNLLSSAARLLSAAIDDVPAVIANQIEKLSAAEKRRRKMGLEIAAFQGRDMFDSASEINGRRVAFTAAMEFDEALRAQAQAFSAQGNGILVASCDSPPSILLAASEKSGVHAGNLLKKLLLENGGRGGGSAQMAQGSLPSLEALRKVQSALEAAIQTDQS